MQLAFENRKVREICEDSDIADVTLGAAVGTALRKRLADLSSARSVQELPPIGNPRVISRDGMEFYMIDLANGYIMEFEAGHTSVPKKMNNTVDWNSVSRIKILKIRNDA